MLTYLTSSYIGDASATLEDRVRSYLDSNCSYCHQPNAASGRAVFDVRLTTALQDAGILHATPEAGSAGLTNAGIIVPGDVENSLIYHRDSSSDPDIRMPPVGRELSDDEYLTVLSDWIKRIGLEGFDLWAQNNGVTGGLVDDQDGDGTVEFFEYLSNTNPNDSSSNGMIISPTGTYYGTGENAQLEGVIFSWIVTDDATLGTDYIAQMSTDAAQFETMQEGVHYTTDTITPGADGTQLVSIRVPLDVSLKLIRLSSPY